jgi:hypothetical protein
MLKRLVTLAVLTTFIAVGVGLYSRGALTQQIDQATLSGKAALAIGRGEYEVNMVNHDSFEAVNSLNDALARYTIVEATPIAKNSYVMDQYSIGTWYKFRINRWIKQNPLPACSDCSSMPDPPAGTSLNWDEMMLLHGGGVQVVDGVTFHVTVPDYPDYSLNQRYLLFIDYDPDKKVGMVSIGPPGIYIVDGYGNLAHIYDAIPDDTIGADLAASYGNNANTLNNAINPPPPPPTCDPYLEQDCWNRGGTWDSFSCYCNEPYYGGCGGGGRYMWDCY